MSTLSSGQVSAYCDQLQIGEFRAVTEALKWLSHACGAHAVGDIYKPRQLLERVEQLL